MHARQAWLPAREFVKAALEGRAEVNPGGEIIRLARACPWKEHLYDLEAEMGLPKPIKFCIYEVPRPKRRDRAPLCASANASGPACMQQ